MSRRLGFSMVEITVVLTVVVLVALVMVPRLTAMRDSQRVASFRLDAERIFREARAEAISRRTDLSLTWDDGLKLSEAASEASSQSDLEETESSQTGAAILSVLNPDGAAQIEEVRLNGETVSSDEWVVEFGATGTVEPAGFSYSLNGRQLWIKVDAEGRVTSGEGEMPEESITDWEAGELEQRV